jgi:hypothetical protein
MKEGLYSGVQNIVNPKVRDSFAANTAALLRFDRRKHPKNGSFKEFEERGVLSAVHFTASGTAAAWNRAQPTMR